MDNSFLSSSFYINSYDSSIIAYPQSYFEYSFFLYFFSKSFDIIDYFNIKENIGIISNIINLSQKVLFNKFLYYFNNIIKFNKNLIFFVKLCLLKFFLRNKFNIFSLKSLKSNIKKLVALFFNSDNICFNYSNTQLKDLVSGKFYTKIKGMKLMNLMSRVKNYNSFFYKKLDSKDP